MIKKNYDPVAAVLLLIGVHVDGRSDPNIPLAIGSSVVAYLFDRTGAIPGFMGGNATV